MTNNQWVGGIDWIPGLRVIPDSPQYRVDNRNHDLTLVDESGVEIPCSLASKFHGHEMACFNWSAMLALLNQKFKDEGIAFHITECRFVPRGVFQSGGDFL